jgi:hypothetical protein
MIGRAVCYHHGGRTPRGIASPQTVHGRYSKDLPTRLAATFAARLADPSLLELSPDLAMLDTLATEAVHRLGTAESGAAWRALRAAKAEFEEATSAKDTGAQRKQLAEIMRLIDRGLGEAVIRTELGELLERRGRLVAIETRRIALAKETLSAGEAMVLVHALISAVREGVHDPATLATIEASFNRVLGRGSLAAIDQSADA